ncbi:MAG: hypothetical protein GY908_13155, partial [Flavobacteriales bacterium]|nr:hypothetical protein [Flavobacteriales bacterium]
EVFLLGQGLQSYDLWQLDDVNVQLLARSQPSGLSRLNYNYENTVGTDLVVKGEYLKASEGQQLLLTGPGDSALDSVQLKSSESQNFKLKTALPVSGKYVYHLIEKDSLGNVVSKDPLAVNIKAKNKLHILIINQFPSFETKYLKNFLAETGHELSVRSQVSKDRFKYEFFNSKQKGRIDINQKSLNEIDLLIIDLNSLKQLSKRNRQLMRKVVSEQGLGLFIQADENVYSSRISLLEFNFLKQSTQEVSLMSSPESSLSKYPFVFKDDLLLESVQLSNEGIVTAYKRLGAGRVGTTVLQNTYELFLDGKISVYNSLWSKTLSMISKRRSMGTAWKSDVMFAFQDAPLEFEITTAKENPIVKSISGFSIPMAQDINMKDHWKGTTYPRKEGWNKLLMNHDSTAVFDFYVHDTSHWTSLVTAKTIIENKRYFQRKEGIVETKSYRKPIQPWWFFLMFLLSMSYLWLEPKL